MSLSRLKHEPGTACAGQGFALVLALALMSFILLLLLSLSSFMRLEMASSAHTIEQEQARQQALLGLQMALGRLQQLAGPDQRSTASAGLFDVSGAAYTLEQPRWVGVWDTREIETVSQQRDWDATTQESKLDSTLGWLVSGPQATLDPTQDPSQGGAAHTIVMANPPGTEAPVIVPADTVLDADGQVTAYVAYWISDESEKARVNLEDPYRNDVQYADSATLAQRYAPEIVFIGSGLSEDAFRRIGRDGDWGFFGLDPDEERWDFTVIASSVLANAAEGGLRTDLTPMVRTRAVDLDNGVTADEAQLPAAFRQDDSSAAESYERYLWVIEDISTEVPTGTSLTHSNARSGDLTNAPLYGPRWEALWDYANGARLLSGNRLNMHEPINTDWLTALESGSANNPLQPALQQVFSPWESYNQGSEREAEIFTPFEAMALGSQGVPQNSSDVFSDMRIEPEHHLLTSAITPIITELVFYVTLTIDPADANEPLKLVIHPYMELSNPYDVDIVIDHRYWLPTSLLSPVFDIQLVDTLDPSNNKIWSVDMAAQISGDADAKSLYRSLGTLFSGARQTLGSTATGEAQSDMAIVLTLPASFTIPAGQTVGYVADTSIASGNVRMQEGSNWWNYGLAAPVKLWANGNTSDTDTTNDEGAYNINWPGVSLSTFDQINLTAFQLPYRWEEGKETGLILNTGGGTQTPNGFGNVRLNYQRLTTYVPFDSLAEHSVEDRGDAFYNEISLFRGPLGWTSTDTDLLVWQLRCLSARDYQNGVNPICPDAGGFLGQSNPRAYTLADPNGLNGREATQTSGWQFSLYPSSSGSLNLQGPGWGEQEGSPDSTFLFHVPQTELTSVGQFRHANIAYGPGDPAYPILGSHRPNGAIPREQVIDFNRVENTRAELSHSNELDFSGVTYADSIGFWKNDLMVDAAFYNNRALLDGYFFSTAPAANPISSDWPNSRMRLINRADPDLTAKLNDSERAASALLLEGGFNVNSTSERAWAAVLAAHLGQAPDGSVAAQSDALYFPRLPGLSEGGNDWNQTRAIDPDSIYLDGQENDAASRTLSKRIVEEVRKRGPFLSVAHFVNRMLVDDERGDAGALQAAIDSSSLNQSETFPQAPGSVTQADILESLVPVLTARGDTFTIRVAAETVDPLTNQATATARCEATVQRLPEYIDNTDAPETQPGNLTTDANRNLGRRFRIINFRWLPGDEQS